MHEHDETQTESPTPPPADEHVSLGEVFRRRKDSSSLPSGWVQVRNRDDDRLVTLPDRDDRFGLDIQGPPGAVQPAWARIGRGRGSIARGSGG